MFVNFCELLLVFLGSVFGEIYINNKKVVVFGIEVYFKKLVKIGDFKKIEIKNIVGSKLIIFFL